jgi:hypothetical protein
MKILFVTGLAAALVACGCLHKPARPPAAMFSTPNPSAPPAAFPQEKPIVTPAQGLVGKVAKVNMDLKYVVLSFPIGHLPALDQHLNLYRRGLKVGEVKITGPQNDENILADIVAGDSEPGDEVRDK